MSKVRRVYCMKDSDEIEQICIFGVTKSEIHNVLTNKERTLSKKVPINGVPMYLYNDDTVDMVMRKITRYMNDILYEDIYLYCKILIENIDDIYDTLLDESDTPYITRKAIEMLIENTDINNIPKKDKYFWEDIKTFQGSYICKAININTDKGGILPRNIVDPFKRKSHDELITSLSYVSTRLNELLGDIGDVIYLVPFRNFINNKSFNHPYFIKTYYRLLYNNGIENFDEYNKQQKSRQKQVKIYYDERIEEMNNNIILMHKQYKPVDFLISEGINDLVFHIQPRSKFSVSLYDIFKTLKTCETMPYVNYNRGGSYQKLYRLYSTKVTLNGKKIPYLTTSKLKYIQRNVGNIKGIITYGILSNTSSIYTEIRTNGLICITISPNKEMVIKSQLLTQMIIEYLEKHFSSMIEHIQTPKIEFNSLFNSNVRVIKMGYEWHFKVKNIKHSILDVIKKMCDIFIYQKHDQKGLHCTYKRVPNFSLMDSAIATIIIMWNQDNKKSTIIDALMTNYGYSFEEADQRFSDVLNNSEFNASKNKHIRSQIKKNPGFATQIMHNEITNIISIRINNISDIQFLDMITLYVMVFMRCLVVKEDTTMQKLRCNTSRESLSDEVSASEVVNDQEKAINEELDTTLNALISSKLDADVDMDELEKYMDVYRAMNNAEDSDITSSEIASELSSKTLSDKPLNNIEMEEEDESVSEDNAALFMQNDDEYSFMVHTPPLASPVHINEDDVQSGGSIFDIRKYTLFPNPIYARLKNMDNELFNSPSILQTYPQSCSATVKKQPISFTESEMAEIDTHHKGSYTNKLKYRGHYYICPRFFSLRYNKPLTEEQVHSKKYGTVLPNRLPKKSKMHTLDPNQNILEFTSHQHIKNGEYIYQSPGFMHKSKHPNGLCMPCCMSAWNGKEQIQRRKECLSTAETTTETTSKTYILTPDLNKPLPVGRYGHLPPDIMAILNLNDKRSKQLLRVGCNEDINHPRCNSFLSAIGYIYSKGETVDVKMFSESLMKSISLDMFVSANNGYLVRVFGVIQGTIDTPENRKHIEKYKLTKTYQSLHNKSSADTASLITMCIACDRFKNYVTNNPCDNDHDLTYRYLWDIICMPNPSLFPNGINLLIISIQSDLIDLLSNARVVCPTNTSLKYDSKKPTALLININEYFEPLFYVETNTSENKITKIDSILINNSNMYMHRRVDHVMQKMIKSCISKVSQKYTFRPNVLSEIAINKLTKAGYEIKNQLIHYSGGVIALYVKSPNGISGVIPTKLSGVHPDLPIETMHFDKNIWLNYEDTRDFLISAADATSLPCRPTIRVMEQSMSVGILTETNQFIPLKLPEMIVAPDGLLTIDGYNHIITDNYQLNTSSEPTDYDRIRLDILLYQHFRTIIMNLLKKKINDSKFLAFKSIIENDDESYEKKTLALKTMIEDLISSNIRFSEYTEKSIFKVLEITHKQNRRSLILEEVMLHEVENGDIVSYIFPKKTFMDEVDTKEFYLSRFVDELTRNAFVRKELYDNIIYSDSSHLDFIMSDTEIITTTLEHANDNEVDIKLHKNFPQEMHQPLYHEKDESTYPTNTVAGIVSGNLLEYIPVNTYELRLEQVNNKTSLNLLKYIYNTNISVVYNSLNSDWKDTIIRIMKDQGKNDLLQKYHTLTEVVSSNDYYTSLIDYILLSNYTKQKLLVYFSTIHRPTNSNSIMIVPSYNSHGNILFIRASNNIIKGQPQEIRVVMLSNNRMMIHESKIDNRLQNLYKKHIYTCESYLDAYKKYLDTTIKINTSKVKIDTKKVKIKLG